MASNCQDTICENIYDTKVLFIRTTFWCIICYMNEENKVGCKNWIFTTCNSKNPLIYGKCYQFSYDVFRCPYKTTNILPTLKTVSINNIDNITSISTSTIFSNVTLNSDYMFSRKGTLAGVIVGVILFFLLMILLILIIIICIRRKRNESQLKRSSEIIVKSRKCNQTTAISNNDNILNSGNINHKDKVNEIYNLAASFNNQISSDQSVLYTPVTKSNKNKTTKLKNKEEIYENENITKISAGHSATKTNKIIVQEDKKPTKLTNDFEMNVYENKMNIIDNCEVNKQIGNPNAINYYYLVNNADDTVIAENENYFRAK